MEDMEARIRRTLDYWREMQGPHMLSEVKQLISDIEDAIEGRPLDGEGRFIETGSDTPGELAG